MRYLQRVGIIVLPAFCIAILFFLQLLPAAAQGSANTRPNWQKRLVADYDEASKFAAPPYTYSAEQIPYDQVTDIIHAGLGFDDDGNLQVPDGFVEPELTARAHDAGDHVVLLIGGDLSQYESKAAATMNKLVANVQEFVLANDYDGVDLDWEYPSTAADAAMLLTFEKALRAVLPSPRYILSVDAAPWSASAYGASTLHTVIDWFNIMTYDCAGPWTAHAQLNSPIFWDNNDPAPEECQPGGSDQESANTFSGRSAGIAAQPGDALLRLQIHERQRALRAVPECGHDQRRRLRPHCQDAQLWFGHQKAPEQEGLGGSSRSLCAGAIFAEEGWLTGFRHL
jgi:GH18 family chitinase